MGEQVAWIAIALLLILIVAAPLAKLLLVSVQSARDGAFTFDNFVTAFSRLRHLRALWNSLLVSAGATVLSALFAIPLAWAVSRTDMPGRRWTTAVAFSAFVTPPYLLAVAWILLAGPNAGWLNRIWVDLTGTTAGPFDIFTYTGLIVVMAANLFYLIYISAVNAFDMVPSDMEDAASMVGAGHLRTFGSITLPLILPALLAGGMMVFLQAMALFAVPALISLPAGIPMLTTQLWEFFQYPVRVGVAAAYALPLLGITAAMLYIQYRLLGRRSFAVVSGKGGARGVVRLGRWRWMMFGYATVVGAIAVYLPMAVLLQAAFSKAWGRGLSLSNFTLGNFRYVLFDHSTAMQALVNSLVYGLICALLAVVLSFMVAYIVSRRIVAFAGVLSFLCMLPVVIPGIVLAIGFYAAYGAPPISLYGTSLILILAFTTRFLPMAYSNLQASMRGLNTELEDAVRSLGGSRMTGLRLVVAPLLRRSLIASAILIFIPASQELSTAILLTGPRTQVLSVVLLGLSDEGNFEALAALGTILLLATFAVFAVSQRLLGRDFMRRSN